MLRLESPQQTDMIMSDDGYDCTGSPSNSDISLGMTSSEAGNSNATSYNYKHVINTAEDNDVLMTSSFDLDDDDDDDRDYNDDMSSFTSDNDDDGSVGDDDDDDDDAANDSGNDTDQPMEHADSLSVTVVTSLTGQITMELGSAVPFQKSGHLTITSRLDRSLPVTLITSMLLLANPHCLKELTISQVALSGNDREFQDFALSIRYLCNLEELHLVDCCLLNDNGARPLDTIIYGISSCKEALPKLHHIELYAVDIDREPVGSFLSPAALAYLVQNKPSLIKLSLEDLTFEDEHVIELAQALTTNTTLKYLKLWGCAVLDGGASALARMLETNASIEQVDLSYNEIGNVGCVALASSLHVNKTLKTLKLVRNKSILLGSKGYEALLEMMKWNHNIEELVLQPSQEVNSDLKFYLFVNRHRYLLENENISKGQLVDMLHTHRSDATFLFHFLKAKPALCN